MYTLDYKQRICFINYVFKMSLTLSKKDVKVYHCHAEFPLFIGWRSCNAYCLRFSNFSLILALIQFFQHSVVDTQKTY